MLIFLVLCIAVCNVVLCVSIKTSFLMILLVCDDGDVCVCRNCWANEDDWLMCVAGDEKWRRSTGSVWWVCRRRPSCWLQRTAADTQPRLLSRSRLTSDGRWLVIWTLLSRAECNGLDRAQLLTCLVMCSVHNFIMNDWLMTVFSKRDRNQFELCVFLELGKSHSFDLETCRSLLSMLDVS